MANNNSLVQVHQLSSTMQHIRSYIDVVDAKKFQKITASGGTINFWTSDDTTGTPAYTVDFPEEIFLDQTRTTFVQSFAWSAATYPDSTNPNLEGKPVLVLAVSGDKEVNPTLAYSFINVEHLVDTYTAGDATITIAGNSVAVQVSSTQGNLLSVANDGLLVSSDNSKVDKVTNAVSGNFATWGASGALTDSGFAVASDSDITALINQYFPSGGSSSAVNP